MYEEDCGTCPICGGNLLYISSLNQISCDTCDYTVEEAM